MMSPVYRARAVQPGTAMTAHGDQVRCHCGAGPFFASGAPSDQRPGDADPALKQIYLCVTHPPQTARRHNYAYYIYGVGHHTEENCRTEDTFMQVYRPLYEEAYAYR